MATEALSEACFLLRAGAQPVRPRRLGDWGFRALLGGRESEAAQQRRFEAFRDTQAHLRGIYAAETARLNATVERDVVAFVRASADATADDGAPVVFRSLPTAIVAGGAHADEDADVLDRVERTLAQDPRLRVASIDVRHCRDMRQLIARVALALADEETCAADLAGIAAQCESMGSPRVVVVLRQFESLGAALFADFVTLCADVYGARLRVTLVLSLGTSPDLVWHSLPAHTHARLAKRQFATEHPTRALDALVERAFVRPTGSPLLLALRPYEATIERFLQHDLSLRGFWRALEYATMDHYYANPLAVLCPPADHDSDETALLFWADSAAALLSADSVALVRRLGSFRAYCQRMQDDDPALVLALLSDDDAAVVAHVPELLLGLWRHRLRAELGLRALQAVERVVLRHTSPLRMLYFRGLQSALSADAGVRAVAEKVNTGAGPALLALADELHGLAHASVARSSAPADAAVVAALDSAREMLAAQRGALLAEVDADDPAGGHNSHSSEGATSLLSISARGILQAAGSTSRTRRAGPLSSLELARTAFFRRSAAVELAVARLSSAVQLLVDTCLGHYGSVPLHEAWYYGHAQALRKALHPEPRAVIQTALAHPRHYLAPAAPAAAGTNKRKAAAGDAADLHEPDTCVLYTLYCQSGRLINLYDLFVAWATTVDARPTAALEGSVELRARFLRSLAELHLMGFVKPTRRKTDHVMRLTWTLE